MPSPLTQIQVQHLSGPQTTRRAAYTNPPVAFGREADNPLVVQGKFVSRKHGELRVDGDAWVIVNQSPNGTEVNGRAVKKPVRLSVNDVVSIGGQELFKVVAMSVAPPPVERPEDQLLTAAAAAGALEARKPVNRRTKLWIGIGVYLLAMLTLMVVLRTLKTGGDTGVRLDKEISPEAIEKEILQPPPRVTIDVRRAEEALRVAREKFGRLHATDDAMYLCYRSYQDAMRFAGRDTLEDGLDQRRFADVQKQLIERVQSEYNRAYQLIKQGDYERAIDAFQHVTRIYPDDASELWSNCMQHRGNAKDLYNKTRRGRR